MTDTPTDEQAIEWLQDGNLIYSLVQGGWVNGYPQMQNQYMIRFVWATHSVGSDDELAAIQAKVLSALSPQPDPVGEAARIIRDEVLQKSCADAAKTRQYLIEVGLRKVRAPHLTRWVRWAVFNAMIHALAQTPQEGEG